MVHGKKYRAIAEKLEEEKIYPIGEVVSFLKDNITHKLDETIELHVNCNLDVKHADQMIRRTVVLPGGTGKDVKIAVFVADAAVAKACKTAGAMEAGGSELVDRVIKDNWTDFDVAVATPDMMRELAKAGKILGTKGLMPNPKAGTVTPDPEKAVTELRAGKIEFKTDSTGIIHMPVGKLSFDAKKLEENLEAAVEAITNAKPVGCKGKYINSAYVATTMGPSMKISIE